MGDIVYYKAHNSIILEMSTFNHTLTLVCRVLYSFNLRLLWFFDGIRRVIWCSYIAIV